MSVGWSILYVATDQDITSLTFSSALSMLSRVVPKIISKHSGSHCVFSVTKSQFLVWGILLSCKLKCWKLYHSNHPAKYFRPFLAKLSDFTMVAGPGRLAPSAAPLCALLTIKLQLALEILQSRFTQHKVMPFTSLKTAISWSTCVNSINSLLVCLPTAFYLKTKIYTS